MYTVFFFYFVYLAIAITGYPLHRYLFVCLCCSCTILQCEAGGLSSDSTARVPQTHSLLLSVVVAHSALIFSIEVAILGNMVT